MKFWSFGRSKRLECKVDSILEGQEKLMALVQVDSTLITQVVNEIATLKADSSTALADIAAKLQGAVTTADPATAAILNQALRDITTLDTNIKAADPGATLPTNPPPPGP